MSRLMNIYAIGALCALPYTFSKTTIISVQYHFAPHAWVYLTVTNIVLWPVSVPLLYSGQFEKIIKIEKD